MQVIAQALRALARVDPLNAGRVLHRLPSALTSCDAVVSYRGMDLLINTGENLGRRIYYWGDYEAQQEAAFANVIDGGLVFDIGANIGVYSILAAKRGANVIAFEPSRKVIPYLRRNIELNSAAVTLVPEAVSDNASTNPFFESRADNFGVGRIFDFGQSSSGSTYDVQSNTLDYYTDRFGVPDVVKLDVEGAEYLVLSGAAGTLAAANAPLFVIEFHAEELAVLGHTVEDCKVLLESHQYRPHPLVSNGSQEWCVFSKRPPNLRES